MKFAEYHYDAWGNVQVINLNGSLIGELNPIRYRGYYYDQETNLYYLNTRYYSPELGRFISPDEECFIDDDTYTGLNLYAYCGNDPVNKIDESGHQMEWQWYR